MTQVGAQKEIIKAEIETIKNNIGKLDNSMNTQKNEIQVISNKKARIEKSRFVKEPTPSRKPVSPNKKMNVVLAGILGLFVSIVIAYSLEYREKQKTKKANQS